MSRAIRINIILRRILTPLKPWLERIVEVEAQFAKQWAYHAHHHLMNIQWQLPPTPENFDHHIDLYYQWIAQRNPLWVERGVFGSLALQGGQVLELSCGDGFNARNFYSLRSKKINACDFDLKAIQTAKKKNSAPNIDYVLVDIRTNMPLGIFENIVWDAAIEHFTADEIENILTNINKRLTPQGILSGYTVVERKNENKFYHHEYEFSNKEDLLRFFSPHFHNVTVFETLYPDRHNLYFWASNGIIPFGKQWPHAATYTKNHIA